VPRRCRLRASTALGLGVDNALAEGDLTLATLDEL
jgi:hypothetical protein